jgi:hypothetical protein
MLVRAEHAQNLNQIATAINCAMVCRTLSPFPPWPSRDPDHYAEQRNGFRGPLNRYCTSALDFAQQEVGRVKRPAAFIRRSLLDRYCDRPRSQGQGRAHASSASGPKRKWPVIR